MFESDPKYMNTDQMQRRVSGWAQGFADKAAQIKLMRVRVEQIQAAASSPDGAVRVTVDSRGVLTDLALNDEINEMRPPELAAQVMACLRRAQQQLALKVRDAMQATVGDEQRLVDNVVSSYRDRFGEDLSQHDTGADPEVMGLGAIEEDTPPPRSTLQAPTRHHRPVPPQDVDEDYFADRGYLS